MTGDLKTLTKYPFHPSAKEYVASLSLTLDQLSAHPVYSAALEAGRKRLKDGIWEEHSADKVSQELSLLSYVVARLIAGATKNRAIMQKFAKSEAYRAYELLRKEPDDVVKEVSQAVGFRSEGDWLPLPEYLHLSRELSTQPQWKLANRIIDSGRVRVRNRSELLELLREQIREKILDGIEAKNLPENIRLMARQFTEDAAGGAVKLDLKQLDESALPPCILKTTARLASGSAAHKDMFILGTFFIGLGLPVDDVVKIFSKSPKFNEEKTRYQLSFLSGKASTTQYSCPTCAKIKTYGLCAADCGVKHPIHYYKDRIKAAKRNEPKTTAPLK